MSALRVVCGLIEDEVGRVLVCRRAETSHLAGKWEFPGGKIEPNESPEQALCRELQEELGVTVVVGDALTEVAWDYGSRKILLQPYRCRVLSGEITLREHSACFWCRAEDLADLDWADADVPIWQEWMAKTVPEVARKTLE